MTAQTKENIQILQIDLFCGAGGVTTGAEKAVAGGHKVCKTIACVNHDANAIRSHRANHSGVYHFTEDIRTMDLTRLIEITAYYHKIYPNAKLLLWASLECTNFSKAKGGLPREADSRTLAEHLFRYIEALNPDLIYIENVEEFMSWGPLNEHGKPISRYEGIDYLRWIERVKSYGYDFDWRILNSADFGAYTARKRYFGQFVKYGLPISWPEPTHAKEAKRDMFGRFEKWRPVREVLDLDEEGESIFNREKPLCEKTLERIYHGLIKFVPIGEGHFIAKYNSNTYKKASTPVSIENPSPVISCQNRLSLIKAKFLQSYYGNGSVHSIDGPCPTVSTHDRFSKITCQFLDKQYGSGKHNCQDLENPAGTITKVPKLNLVTAKWVMDTNFRNVGSSIEDPAPTILASHKHHYLMHAQFKSKGGSVDHPCFTLIARMDKIPPYLITANEGFPDIEITDSDSYFMKKIKIFMKDNGIVDIKMRMLFISELKRITGFSDNYVLIGTQAEQKKFIGNAVPVLMAQRLIEACAMNLMSQISNVA